MREHLNDIVALVAQNNALQSRLSAAERERDANARILAALPGSPHVLDLANAARHQMQRADAAEMDVDSLRTALAGAEARAAAVEAGNHALKGLLASLRMWAPKSPWDTAIEAALTPAPTKPVRCWDRDLCCGDDLCKFKNGETLPPNTYCAHDDKPEGGEVARG